jgi:hypothetical protein
MSLLTSFRRLLGRSSGTRRPVTRTTLGLTCLEGRSLPSATVMSAGRHGGPEHPAEVRHEPQIEVNHQNNGGGQAGDVRSEDRGTQANDVRREDRQADRGAQANDKRREDRRADRTGTPGADDPAGHDAGHPEVRHGGRDDGPNHR